MSNLPQLTEEERSAALKKAMEVRFERAAALKALKSGETPVSDAIEMPIMQRVKVSKFIASCPGFGKALTERVMMDIGIAANRRVGGLGVRQKSVLLEKLCGGAE